MNIAIPIEHGRLHGHFGGCREFALVEVDADQKLALRTEIVSAPEHRPGLFPLWLRGAVKGEVLHSARGLKPPTSLSPKARAITNRSSAATNTFSFCSK